MWRKHSFNGRLYKFLVLLGFTKSPTLQTVMLPEEYEKLKEAFTKALKD